MTDSTESTDQGTKATSSTSGCCVWLLDWIDARAGVRPAIAQFEGPLPGGARWRSVWPSMILFTFVVQAITGFVLWMFYSPSAQSAWESVYYLQHEVTGGWLLRGVHHYAAQVLVALTALYVVQIILTNAYRAPRELVYWAALLMGLLSLGCCLTGDLLAWDQNSYASTIVRTKFLMLLPWIGDDLFRLAAGGPAFGHLTLTRFLALHVGVFASGFLVLLILHGWLRRRTASAAAEQTDSCPICECLCSLGKRFLPRVFRERSAADRSSDRYWPDQLARNAASWLVVILIVGFLVGSLGIELGAPADPDPANFYAAARPEWSFRGLYQLSNMFPGDEIPLSGVSWKIVPIFVLPGMLVVYFAAIPFIGRLKRGYRVNTSVLGFLILAIVVLSIMSWRHDAVSTDHQAALADGAAQTDRVMELADAPGGIPVTGALSLLRTDPKTQGPVICEKQCAVCHNYSAPKGNAIIADDPCAPELYGFAGRQWLAGLFDPDQVEGPNYYGNTRFAAGIMVRDVQKNFAKLPEEEQTAIIAALSAEARLPSQQAMDAADEDLIAKGRELIVERKCTRCHGFHGEGPTGAAPDLTGYGSPEWIVGIIADPTHDWFYNQRNDRMPAYLQFPMEPQKNRLAARDVQLVTNWLRGEWYEPGEVQEAIPSGGSPMLTMGLWMARRAESQPIGDDPSAQAMALYQREHCAICHGFTRNGDSVSSAEPSAPDLGGFAGQQWIAGLLDPKQVNGPKYFGNSAFDKGSMVGFVRSTLKELIDELGEEELSKLMAALAAEAKRDVPADPDDVDDDTKYLFEDFTCTECHRFYDLGDEGQAPDLTGYGSQQWLVEFISDPTKKKFYGSRNHGMPSYRMFEDEPRKNLLTEDQLELLADWLRESK